MKRSSRIHYLATGCCIALGVGGLTSFAGLNSIGPKDTSLTCDRLSLLNCDVKKGGGNNSTLSKKNSGRSKKGKNRKGGRTGLAERSVDDGADFPGLVRKLEKDETESLFGTLRRSFRNNKGKSDPQQKLGRLDLTPSPAPLCKPLLRKLGLDSFKHIEAYTAETGLASLRLREGIFRSIEEETKVSESRVNNSAVCGRHGKVKRQLSLQEVAALVLPYMLQIAPESGVYMLNRPELLKCGINLDPMFTQLGYCLPWCKEWLKSAFVYCPYRERVEFELLPAILTLHRGKKLNENLIGTDFCAGKWRFIDTGKRIVEIQDGPVGLDVVGTKCIKDLGDFLTAARVKMPMPRNYKLVSAVVTMKDSSSLVLSETVEGDGLKDHSETVGVLESFDPNAEIESISMLYADPEFSIKLNGLKDARTSALIKESDGLPPKTTDDQMLFRHVGMHCDSVSDYASNNRHELRKLKAKPTGAFKNLQADLFKAVSQRRRDQDDDSDEDSR